MTDLTDLDFSLSMGGSGFAGSFYKAIVTMGNYYKVSYILKDGFGFESVNEVLASRLACLLGYKNAGYELVNARIRLSGRFYETYVCKSKSFKKENERRVTLETYEVLNGIEKGFIKPLIFKPFFSDLLNLIFFDYIIDNRDRHGANIELLVEEGSGRVRLAPIFDCGSSLLAPCQYNKTIIEGFSYLHDGPVNNFLISLWWGDVLEELKNVGFVVPTVDIDGLVFEDLKAGLKEGYGYILNKEVEMIKTRYEHAKKIFNS